MRTSTDAGTVDLLDSRRDRKSSLARSTGLAVVAAATLLIAWADAAGASGYHSCANIRNGGAGISHVRVKRTGCSTARFVLRHNDHPGWSCQNLPGGRNGFPVVCKHSGGKVIRATYGD